MASASKLCVDLASKLSVDLVEEIFLRLDNVADLVRASAACAAFRRVVSDGRFLRRFRSLHRRPVLGLLHRGSSSRGLRFHPAEPPRRSASLAAGLSSSSFLPAHPTEHCWHIHDARDGRVLLSPAGDATDCCSPSMSYLVVYDPLHCKRVEIPPIPIDIVGRHGHYCSCDDCDVPFKPFLIPAAADEDLSFRVMCTVLSTYSGDMEEYEYVVESFVYSSVTRRWSGVASLRDADYYPLSGLSLMDRYYAHGCFYWVDSLHEDMLVLDMNQMKFSVVSLPPGTKQSAKFRIVVQAAEEDRIGLLVLCENTRRLHLCSTCANDCWRWRRHDTHVTLPDSYAWFSGGAADHGYALLQGIPRDEYVAWWSSYPSMSPSMRRPKTNVKYFTVELQTLLLEQLCMTEFDFEPAFLYASFPPPFAPPRI